MAVTVTATPSSGTAVLTAFRISVLGLPANDVTTYVADTAGSEVQLKYYIEMSEGGLSKGRSHVFSPNPSTGGHVWDNIIAPDAGTYVFTVKNAVTNASVKSTSVTVA